MSRIISSATKDCIKTEKYDLSGDMRTYDNRKDVPSDESNLGLFRKYVLSTGQQSKGKRAEEELSESIRNKLRFSAMHPQQFAYTSRPSTLLEKHLLPVLESSAKLPTSSGESKTSKPQLTIFYNGAISVYDNVSADQAQAIFLLASGATGSPPVVTDTPKVDIAKPQKVHQPDTTLSICNLKAGDLPLARTISLQHFLEKRRRRIMNKSPYPAPSSSTTRHDVDKGLTPYPAPSSSTTRHDVDKELTAPSSSTTRHDVDKELTQMKLNLNNSDESNEEKSFLSSPFPSRGFFFPISTSRHC